LSATGLIVITDAHVLALHAIMPHTNYTIRPFLEYEAAWRGVMFNIAMEIGSARSVSQLVQMDKGHMVMSLNSIRGRER